VVLFRAVQNYNFDAYTAVEALDVGGNFLYLFFTSTIFGVSAGLLSAYIIKTLYFGR
jgi:sodium/hydrogen exchanger 8